MDNNKLSKRFIKNNQSTIKQNNFIKSTPIVRSNDVTPEISEISNEDLENDFKNALLEKIDAIPVWFEYSTNRQKELIRNFIDTKIQAENIQISNIDKDVLVDNLLGSITNFGAIQDLLDNEKVSAVIVNGTKSIHIEIDGKVLNTETNLSDKQLKFLINSISCMSGIDEFKGLKQFVIKDYSLTVIGNDISSGGINITIKKQSRFTPEFLIQNGMMTEEIYNFLVSAINMKKNILISGGINSGKTVLTDVLCSSCLENKRSFVIEKTPQISTDFDAMVKLKFNEDVISYVIKALPEYLVSDLNYIEPEFVDVKGFLSTVRANSVEAGFQALVGMCIISGLPEKFARMKALKNFDYIVQLERDENGICRLTAIVELTPAKTMQASVKTLVKYAEGEYVSKIVL